MSKAVNLIFPHQLFACSPLIDNGNETYLIEEFLYFKQYPFHKQKIAFHRASMKSYQTYLVSKGVRIHYIESSDALSDIRKYEQEIIAKSIDKVIVIDTVDYWLEQRLEAVCKDIELKILDSPQFLSTPSELSTFFKPTKKSFFQTTFYKQQRKRLNILLDADEQPAGGKWTYDTENRKKYPKGKQPPSIHFPESCKFWEEAMQYTNANFSDNLGEISDSPVYPINHEEAECWFTQFLEYRFHEFGAYEDAIVKEYAFLNHSILSPLLNTGLIPPGHVIETTLAYAEKEQIPINSTEGFVRQIIGWREFIRGMYISKGVYSRTKNHFNFTKKIPSSFYDGSTGIEPIDITIKKVLKTGYCHHIERLMILGNFMILCEFDPDEVYRWFMELFIDAYDWVMVPNVYGMSQFADGGTFATKPYIGGSNYIKKMSNYKGGEWEKVWDGLFWRFVGVHQDLFKSNPRIAMMYHSYHRMTDDKRNQHLLNAQQFLDKLE